MKARDIMTKRPITVRPADTLGKVVRILADKKISGCPVVEKGKLVGIVTQTDVIRTMDVYEKINKGSDMFSLVVAVIKSNEYDNMKVQLKKMLNMKVREFMEKKVVSIEEDDDVYKAAKLIDRHSVDRLPVVKKGKLTGIVTKTDIIKELEKLEK
ncbi:MAG TPA: CBS domain-containing protein [Candidatus Aenigmarchaeota archaeon]|nr:CBS domain-containing protein [Candidatus Aenigmarchaeota archaeon]